MKLESAIRSIAKSPLSVSRIKRIIKALYGEEVSPQEIAAACDRLGIATPSREKTGDIRDQYPDEYTFLLESRTFWRNVRRYWGDDNARTLAGVLSEATASMWRGLYPQLASYSTSGIHDRRKIDLSANSDEPLETEKFYTWDLQVYYYLQGIELEFRFNC